MKECLYLELRDQLHTASYQQRIIDSCSPRYLDCLDPTEMPCWYYDKNDLRQTPSIRDGIPFETERRYRKEGARFIMSCGTQMGLGHNTIATGVVYFHRFYMFHSFRNFPRYVTACCCLFLAGKVEETPKKCRDIIKIARSQLSDNYFFSFGEDPKEEVMTLERILLQTIKFDLQVEHPYSFLLKYAKCFKSDQLKLQKMVQMAWNFVNDSLSSVVCLQWEPEIVAVALIHLASKLSKFTVVDWVGREENHDCWWDMFVSNVTMDLIEDICHQVLDLYQSNKTESQNSPPQKPPSRADSPPPSALKGTPGAGHVSGVNTTSPQPPLPLGVIKGPRPPIRSGPANHVAGNSNASGIPSLVSVGGGGGGGGGSDGMNNLQAIKSLANSAPPPPPPEPVASTSAAAAAIAGSYHNMYAAPHLPTQHQHSLHSMYGHSVGGSAAPPPPGPPHSYGMVGPGNGAGSSALAGGGNGAVPPPLPPPPLMPSYGGGPSAHPSPWATAPTPLSNHHHHHPYAGGGGNGSGVAPPPPQPPHHGNSNHRGGYYQTSSSYGHGHGRGRHHRY